MTRRLGSGEGGIVSWPVGEDGEVVGFGVGHSISRFSATNTSLEIKRVDNVFCPFTNGQFEFASKNASWSEPIRNHRIDY